MSTGASALLAAGLAIRREATGDDRYDDVLARLGASSWRRPSRPAPCSRLRPGAGAPVPGDYSKYYTGEAYWALARWHRAVPARAWVRRADRIGTYLATERDEAEDHWPPIPDHWAAYGSPRA